MPFAFANPWGLLGLLSLPAIVVIHMYHHRYPPLLIAGSHLWGVDVNVTTAGRRRERLPITKSLILELLAALVLSLVLAHPTFGGAGTVTHFVVVLDNSASMQAAPPGEPSFRDQAVGQLEQRLAGLEREAVITLITTGRRVEKLIGPVGWQEAKNALARWQPGDTGHDFQPAWDQAAQLAEGKGQLLFLTDHLPPENIVPPAEMEVVSVGRKLENVALTTARWTFDAESRQGNLFCRIANQGAAPAETTIRGMVGKDELFARRVTISPNATAPVEIPVPGGIGELQVRLSAPNDGLPVDNVVTLIEPQIRTVKVGLELAAENPARDPLQRLLEVVPDVEVNSTDEPHLVIGPAGTLPESRGDLWWLGIGPIDLAEEAREAARDLLGPYLLEKQHPLLDGVVLGGVVWGGVQPLPYEVIPVVSSGETVLMGQLPGTATTAFAMNIDFGRSNLSESPDWPILMVNLVEQRRDALPGLRQWNYRLNEDVQFRLYEGYIDPADGDDPPPLTLVHGEEERPLVRSGLVYITQLDDTGVYVVREGERTVGRFAVNFFDPEESNLKSLTPGERAPREVRRDLFAVDDPYSWLIMLGTFLIIAFILLDWYVLQPKSPRAA